MTIFEGEGEGLLRDLSSPLAQQALEQMTTFIHQHLGKQGALAIGWRLRSCPKAKTVQRCCPQRTPEH